MPKVTVNNISMNYEIHGEGFPIVMITGLSFCLRIWDKSLIDELSKKFKVILFDNRGAGQTDIPEGEFTIKMMADDTVGLMDILNIECAYVLGFSMGGMIAQEVVLNYPQKVEKLILWGTACGGRKSIPPDLAVYKLLIGAIEDLTPERLAKSTIPLVFTRDFIKNNPEYINDKIQRILKCRIPFSSYARQAKAMFNFNICRRLKKIYTPTLIMQGKHDILVPPQNSEILAELIPGARLIIFENSGHAIYPHESELFITSLLEFLE
ncbi:MAG: alpha/beta hydrolase [Candidatus Lokiarchaeota archaeon]|nr:alpha/beta hydrolase [Candidatus Lokiarchaeota archaeon]